MGCNSTCAYCIVPAVRGREESRSPGRDRRRGRRGLAADGVRELTLLGQNVNSWGRDLRPAIETEFAELLRACDAVEGIDRIRFTSPHPKDFRPPVIAAMAACPSVCEHVHLPLQSGSTPVLKRDAAHVPRERYLRLVGELRAAIPDLALATDLIVGFPGETEADFQETLDGRRGGRLRRRVHVRLLAAARNRGGRAAATRFPKACKHERMETLVEVVQRVAERRNAERVGRVEEVLVEGASRTDRRAPSRPDAPQHHGRLRGRRRAAESSWTSASTRPRRRRFAAPSSPSPPPDP